MAAEHVCCSPCQIVAEVASLMQVRADAKGLPFNIEYVGPVPETIQSDPTRLRQILSRSEIQRDVRHFAPGRVSCGRPAREPASQLRRRPGMSLSRREFVVSAAGLAAVGIGGRTARVVMAGQRDEQTARRARQPMVIASGNGTRVCNHAMELLKQGGDPVDAVVSGVNLVEDDPKDHSVGLGGLPNEDGVVELDACVMHGPTHKGGAVAVLRGIRNPASVAKLVMQRTDHVMLVGEGARRFAKAHGFKEEELLTDQARRMWLDWRERHSDRDNWLHPEADDELSRRLREEGYDPAHGTITCMALTLGGDLGGCTSTSGRAFKIPGRVSDSCILGAGLYVDNQAGACGSTGRGEANLVNCSCFLVAELMRGGASPEEACRQVLRRVADKTEKRLRDGKGVPRYQLTLYALRRDGLAGGACMRASGRMTVHDGDECRRVEIPGLFQALESSPRP